MDFQVNTSVKIEGIGSERLDELSASRMQDADYPYFQYLVGEFVSGHYPETESSYTHDVAFRGSVGSLLTQDKIVWAVHLDGQIVGFFVATRKPDFATKFGPIVIDPAYQSQGIGKKILRMLMEWYCSQGSQKFYLTVPTPNLQTCNFALALGFRLEATLRRQYSPEHDEMVFGKLAQNGKLVSAPGRKFEKPHLRPTPKVERLLEMAIDAEQKEARHDPTLSAAKSFIVNENNLREAFIVCSPKRGGSVKLGPIGGTPRSVASLIPQLESFYFGIGRSRRIFALIEGRNRNTIAHFVRNGYELEGRISSALGTGFDQIVVAKNWR